MEKNWRKFTNYLMPYDVYERHQVASQILKNELEEKEDVTVLDVGGRINLLDRFLPYETISVNPDGSGMVWGSGMALPFGDNIFDAVVTIDTLEHLPQKKRLPFIQECMRVARSIGLVAAPFGSAGHTVYEKRLNELHKEVLGKPHLYLNEHIRYGLPTAVHLKQVVHALKPASATLYYAGNYIWQVRSFARAIQANKQPRLFAMFSNVFNRLTNLALFHPIKLTHVPQKYTNRFYLLVRNV